MYVLSVLNDFCAKPIIITIVIFNMQAYYIMYLFIVAFSLIDSANPAVDSGMCSVYFLYAHCVVFKLWLVKIIA